MNPFKVGLFVPNQLNPLLLFRRPQLLRQFPAQFTNLFCGAFGELPVSFGFGVVDPPLLSDMIIPLCNLCCGYEVDAVLLKATRPNNKSAW